jgi:hypothetical protein
MRGEMPRLSTDDFLARLRHNRRAARLRMGLPPDDLETGPIQTGGRARRVWCRVSLLVWRVAFAVRDPTNGCGAILGRHAAVPGDDHQISH